MGLYEIIKCSKLEQRRAIINKYFLIILNTHYFKYYSKEI